jgi:hypothetical protein
MSISRRARTCSRSTETSILKDLTAREARFLSALHDAASFEAARWQRQIIDHEITRHQLLNIYADAGLSRQPRLSPLSFGDFSEHREDLNADLRSSRPRWTSHSGTEY